MQIIIDIDEEDFKIMKHNIAIDNPLCPLGQREMVTAVASGVPLPKNATNGDRILAIFPDAKVTNMDSFIRLWFDDTYYTEYNKEWWNAPYQNEVSE